MASETFHIKASARQMTWLAPVIGFVVGVALFVFAGPVSEQAGDMSPTAAKRLMNILGVLALAGGMYFVYNAFQVGRSFLTLSDKGVNLNNRWIAKWSDIESVDEEAIDIDAKGVTVNTKYKLWIKYIDQQERKTKKFCIVSDFEGYKFIKERIMNRVAAKTTTDG